MLLADLFFCTRHWNHFSPFSFFSFFSCCYYSIVGKQQNTPILIFKFSWRKKNWKGANRDVRETEQEKSVRFWHERTDGRRVSCRTDWLTNDELQPSEKLKQAILPAGFWVHEIFQVKVRNTGGGTSADGIRALTHTRRLEAAAGLFLFTRAS